ncbi:hypothetical protein HZH68_017134 [Vespula germanica]|uniref:Uncharacterized protein n=1 Tax=Vespula germanica TaxID=30212 RepID=A0A834J2C2_VESGE|nr:hypothetical protein HZH68_017134 [Vespula germanica]
MVNICMLRMKKPEQLTSGEFTTRVDQPFCSQSVVNLRRDNMETKMKEIGVANVLKSYNWNTRLLKCVGVWPLQIYDPIFLFFFLYLSIHCSLTFAHLIFSPKTVDNVVSNISENIILTMTLTKITITRINRESLGKLLIDVKEDSLSEKYKSKDEKEIFYKYTKLPPRFILTAVIAMTVAILLYYVNGLKIGLQIGN